MEHKTNDWVRSKINFLKGLQEPLLATVKRRKLAWFGHVTSHDSLSKTLLQGTLEGGRRRGRQRECWINNIKEWTSVLMPELPTKAFCRKDWKRISAKSSLISPKRHNRSRDWTERTALYYIILHCIAYIVSVSARWFRKVHLVLGLNSFQQSLEPSSRLSRSFDYSSGNINKPDQLRL